MRLRSKSMLFVAASVAFLSATTITSASASPGAVLSAETTGAFGDAYVTFASRTYASKIEFRSVDLLADGHHARLRLITKRSNGVQAAWPWRMNYGGKGAQPEWTTSLTDAQGIAQVRLQVCRAEGDTLLNCAYSDWKSNALA
ncbi:hypothetical protein [Streptomyces sp. NBC_00893]|uniref:hypothetical protein n=1 Tax=Streptomyces sp. NBC_00893 TaxID=2975862 RepID=UPI00224D812F|nr:hypothetical protein [Streptomyces sp. NBC_00893]MCX4846775.1 hypothetical protein [Streptomyces sp. NBC_00893]